MGIPLLVDIFFIFALSILVTILSLRIRIPILVGFLLTGILAGPYGFKLIHAVHEVEILAEIGVILLLFTIGMEFSLESLLQIKRIIFFGGMFQVFCTILIVFLGFRQAGQSFGESIFAGFLIASSSTAIILKILQEVAEIDSPHGRISLAILIFQDIIVVPMMLFIPLLTGKTENLSNSLFLLLMKGSGIILFVILSSRWLVPTLLFQVLKTRSVELFLLCILTICLGIVWLSASLGLSLALGAFLAGLIISESEYAHEALSNILPFKTVFSSLFFVSIGMLLDVRFLMDHLLLVSLGVFGVLLLKAFVAILAVIILGYPMRSAILVGLLLCQIGEFSFILAKQGLAAGLIPQEDYQLFLSISLLTMIGTPFILVYRNFLADLFLKIPFPVSLKRGSKTIQENQSNPLHDHLIIVGYGLNGRNLAKAAKVSGIQYVILEMNPEVVQKERLAGELIYYGDATNQVVLEHIGIYQARIIVIAISDPVASRRVTDCARKMNSAMSIIVRTRYIQEMKPLLALGASEVIPEEFETSIEIFTRVLLKYLVPRAEIEKFITELRSDQYEMFRTLNQPETSIKDLKIHLPHIEISSLKVDPQSTIAGKTLMEIEMRKKYEVNVLAIQRSNAILLNPNGEMPLLGNDLLFVIGTSKHILELTRLLDKL
ncbi:MAG: cation:proton antiporter [Planctomycetota bacterium]